MNYANIAIRKPFFCILFLLLNFSLYSNPKGDSSSSYFISGVRLHYGFIFAHTKDIQKAAHSHPVGIQVDFGWHLTSNKAYDYCNCYPRLGLSLYYWDFRNPEILGTGINLIGFAEPFIKAYKKLSFSIRPGIGVAYHNNPYDEITNPDNLCYSTAFSYALLLNGTLNIRISNHLIFNIAFNYNHISNGGVKMPNKGLNYPSFSLGLDFSSKPLNFQEKKQTTQIHFEKKLKRHIGLFVGFKGVSEDDNLYFVKGIFGKLSKQISRSSALAGGIELIADGSEKQKDKLYTGVHNNAQYMGSVMAGYEYLLGRFALTIDLGFYFYNTDRRTDIIYQRYGMIYKISEKVFTGINLKAYRHVADFFDIRLGVTF
ncbi:MAG: acyloxyacyl hydrolase [Bacteroidetes bacterium]|nr:acyloxyacyl hydrolase [Bacteroidota bacterium]MBL7103840.1 acyloxyacyl hydrolase [Bacteroidales bacterium]